MKNKQTLIVAAALFVLLICGGTVAFAGDSEDFGTGGAVLITDLGWTNDWGDNIAVDSTYSAYPGWTGRSTNTQSGRGGGWGMYNKGIANYPTTGLWKFSADVYNKWYISGENRASQSHGSYIGLGRGNAAKCIVIQPLAHWDGNLRWRLDATVFTNSSGSYVDFGDDRFINAPCRANFFVDFDNGKIWATMTNQNTGAFVSSSVLSYTPGSYNGFWTFQYQDIVASSYKTVGMPVDNLSWSQEKLIEISYQGKLSNSSQPVNGTASVKFDLYADESGGSAVWSGTAGSVTVNNGVFSKNIGPVYASLFQACSTLWLEITVDGQVMTPRAKLATAPYAATTYTTK